MKFNLIGVYSYFKTGKTHISKTTETMDTYCGKYLGFDYGLVSETGFENDTAKQFSLNEIKEVKTICKSCLKAVMNTHKQQH